jgi:transposase
MNPAPEPLPNDVAALRAMLIEVRAERDAERAEKAQLAAQNDRLRHLIRQLQRLRFGRRSEKLDPDQLNLALEAVKQAIAETVKAGLMVYRRGGAKVYQWAEA